MARGISTVNVANKVLDWIRGVAPTPPAQLWAQLRIGDPGANGTANPSAVTVRVQVTMTAAAGGSISLNTVSGSWSMTTTETITDLSIHDASAAGNFLWSVQLGTPRTVNNGDTLTLSTLTLGNSPLAA